MQTKLTIIALCLVAGVLQAGEINEGNYPLQYYRDIWGHYIALFDEARTIPATDAEGHVFPPGWVGQYGRDPSTNYGVLNGGTLFNTSLIGQVDPTQASVTWNFGSTGYRMTWIDVFTILNGVGTETFYLCQGADFRQDGGFSITTDAPIASISFWGHAPGMVAGDNGQSALLLAIALLVLIAGRRMSSCWL